MNTVKLCLRSFLHSVAGLIFDLFVKRYTFDGMTFEVPKHLTDRAFRGRFVLGTYESSEEYKFIDKYLDKNAVLLELGGCLGVMSCYSNKHLKNPSKHVVVEANPNLIPWLTKNRNGNQRGFIVQHGVVSKASTQTFHIHDLIVGGSLKRVGKSAVTVPGLTLEGLQQIVGSKFTALIMDIEGGEYALLFEYPEFFSPFDMIFLELHPFAGILTDQESMECEGALQRLGFDKIDSGDGGIYQVWKRSAWNATAST